MPKNIAGKAYDLRPYVDELDWLVIRRGSNKVKFKLIKNKLYSRVLDYYHIDRYDLCMMQKQARKLIPMLVNK